MGGTKRWVEFPLKILIFLVFLLYTFGALSGVQALEPIHVGEEIIYGFAHGDGIWLGTTRDGIFVASLTGGDVIHLIQGEGIPVNRTVCGVSAFGKIWLGSPAGLWVSSDGQNWDLIGTEHLPSTQINCLGVQGVHLWVGTNKGAGRYDSKTGSWRTYTKDDGLSDNWVLSIHSDGDLIWFGSMRGGVCEYNPAENSWRTWKKTDGVLSNTVFSVCVSPELIFAGTTGGLSVIDRKDSSCINYGPDVLTSPSVYATLWVPELGEAWIGTGYGLCIWDSHNRTIDSITKIGEIEVEKVNDLASIGGAVWVLRAKNLWYKHRTTGALGFDISTSSWLRPIQVDVLVDQSGYGPGDPKRFIVQSNEPIDGEGRFRVMSGAGKEVYSGELGSRFDREDWDAYYWIGDFTDLQRRGNFTIKVDIGDYSGVSFTFEMDNDVLLDECGELIYEFLRYMRCGIAHEYRSKPCHLDDGILPNGTHVDATGGWHCAGLWGGKYSEYHTYVLFNLILARDLRPDFFDPIDRDSDGLADILNEAMWGCDFLLKMQMENGSIFHEVKKIETTDGIIGTYDDRPIRGWMPTYNGLLAVAGLAGTSALVADLYPNEAEGYLDGALLSFDFYGSCVSQGPGSSVEGAAMVLACAELFRATSNITYLDLAERYCNATLTLPFSGYYGTFVPVALGHYVELNPSTIWKESIAKYLADLADTRLAEDTASSNPRLPFEILTWRLYIMDPWAAEVLFAYRLTGNLSYLEYGIRLIDCHLGVNPYDMCMLEGTGTYNSGGYGSHFRSPTNPRGSVPGSIPQGIRPLGGRPSYDISVSPCGESAETWLINTNFLQAISLVPKDIAEYPLEVFESLLLPVFTISSLLILGRRVRPT